MAYKSSHDVSPPLSSGQVPCYSPKLKACCACLGLAGACFTYDICMNCGDEECITMHPLSLQGEALPRGVDITAHAGWLFWAGLRNKERRTGCRGMRRFLLLGSLRYHISWLAWLISRVVLTLVWSSAWPGANSGCCTVETCWPPLNYRAHTEVSSDPPHS